MDIVSAATINAQVGKLQRPSKADCSPATSAKTDDPNKSADTARQFEAILIRQILSESMKPLLEAGPSGQVYGYLLTDSLADGISKGGGLGLSHILQTQFDKQP